MLNLSRYGDPSSLFSKSMWFSKTTTLIAAVPSHDMNPHIKLSHTHSHHHNHIHPHPNTYIPPNPTTHIHTHPRTPTPTQTPQHTHRHTPHNHTNTQNTVTVFNSSEYHQIFTCKFIVMVHILFSCWPLKHLYNVMYISTPKCRDFIIKQKMTDIAICLQFEVFMVWGTAWRIVCLWKAIIIDNFTLF